MSGQPYSNRSAGDGLDETLRFRAWAPELKARWYDFFAARINRELRFMHAVGLATCIACLFLDAQAGVFDLGLQLRLGLVAPAYLVAIALLRRGNGVTRTLATVVPIALFAGVATYLGLAAQSVFTDRYVMASAMLIAFCLVLLPLRIGPAVVLAGAGFGAIAIPLLAMSGIGSSNADLFVFALLCCTVPIAIKLRSDRVKDSNFILTLKSRQAQEELLATNRQLESLSSIDALTGVLNRRGFEKKFEAAYEAALQSDEPLAVLLLDIDHFKLFNDTHGHQAGDRCLIEVGRVLNSEIRRHDGAAGRYGGEEFIAALRGRASGDADGIAHRILTQISQLVITDHQGRMGSVTASVGVRVGSPLARSRDEFVKDADRALYAAKGAGRDRVVVFVDEARDSHSGSSLGPGLDGRGGRITA